MTRRSSRKSSKDLDRRWRRHVRSGGRHKSFEDYEKSKLRVEAKGHGFKILPAANTCDEEDADFGDVSGVKRVSFVQCPQPGRIRYCFRAEYHADGALLAGYFEATETTSGAVLRDCGCNSRTVGNGLSAFRRWIQATHFELDLIAQGGSHKQPAH